MLDRPPSDAGKANGAADKADPTFERTLAGYRDLTTRALLNSLPPRGPPYLYKLVSDYPGRGGKGLRAALCLATCGAFGGRESRALPIAVAIELFHNGFLIHDDVQDASLSRRGGDTLHRAYGTGIAINVGNATNLLGLRRVIESRSRYGPTTSFALTEETECMMRHSLEGQAIELAWIRDNVCRLKPDDYLRMCLKKTSWYSFIYPMRAGAIIARGGRSMPSAFPVSAGTSAPPFRSRTISSTSPATLPSTARSSGATSPKASAP